MKSANCSGQRSAVDMSAAEFREAGHLLIDRIAAPILPAIAEDEFHLVALSRVDRQ